MSESLSSRHDSQVSPVRLSISMIRVAQPLGLGRVSQPLASQFLNEPSSAALSRNVVFSEGSGSLPPPSHPTSAHPSATLHSLSVILIVAPHGFQLESLVCSQHCAGFVPPPSFTKSKACIT